MHFFCFILSEGFFLYRKDSEQMVKTFVVDIPNANPAILDIALIKIDLII